MRHPHAHAYFTETAFKAAPQKHIRDSGCPNLGHVIAKARYRADLKQATLAEKIGVSRARLAQWERGKRPVPEAMIAPLRDALAPDLDDLEIKVYDIWPHHGRRFARLA